ncbi:MAG: ZIP family metal transporter, partial [Bacillota bacterium]|nr:ZIP family metal transporter [Bacillota bacterium]
MSNITQILIGITIPFIGTALGSSMVFSLKREMKPFVQKFLLG